MEALAIYLVKSSALIALFYLAYYFLLRKETFFISNRWFLLLGLVTSVMLPLVTYKKVVWIDPLPANIDWANIPYATVTAPAEGFEIDWMLVTIVVYSIGIFGFLLSFLLDFHCLNKALRGRPVLRQSDYLFVETDEKVAPFSYFGYIVFNSSMYNKDELANIIEHEKVHSRQNHTMDVLFARFFCIVFWFNPFIWLYKKSILQNLEFIADAEATRNLEDKRSYQITLLKVTAHENCVDISNHFYQSLIKKRIVMLNKNQSKKSNSWKYFLIIPVLAAFMVYFQVRVVAQERAGAIILENGVTFRLDKNTTDAEIKSEAERLKKEHGVTLKCSKVKRNSSGEIVGIKMTYKDASGKKGTTQVSGEEPIQPIYFYKDDDRVGFRTGSNRDIRVVGVGPNGVPQAGNFNFDFDFDNLIGAPEPPQAPEPPENMDAPLPPNCNNPSVWTWNDDSNIVIKNKDGKQLVIVDGKVVSDVDVEKILADVGPIIIDGEDVLKKGHNYAYSYSKNGNAVVIDTKKITADAMKKASDAMRNAAPEMKKAREQMDKARDEMDRQREDRRIQRSAQQNDEMQKARAEMEQARQEMQKTKAELDKIKAELKAEIEKQKAAGK